MTCVRHCGRRRAAVLVLVVQAGDLSFLANLSEREEMARKVYGGLVKNTPSRGEEWLSRTRAHRIEALNTLSGLRRPCSLPSAILNRTLWST